MLSIEGEDALPDDITVMSVSFTKVGTVVTLHPVTIQAGKEKKEPNNYILLVN